MIFWCRTYIGDKLFHQCIGIPMGIDPAPFWANLHLYSYECEFITSLMRSDKGRAMKFRNASRFIDDECNLNDGGEFGRSLREIYQPELELKCEHEGSHATFLDVDGKFVYKLFDKRNAFPFFIVETQWKHSCSYFLWVSYVGIFTYSSFHS